MKKKIGIFDSGIGGLTIAKELLKFSNLEIIYYADTKYLPYGNKSFEEIKKLSKSIVDELLSYQVETIIIACHTISIVAHSYLETTFPDIPIISVAPYVIDSALSATHNKKIGILATEATIASHYYQQALLHKNASLEITEQECPQLANLIEEHDATSDRIHTTLEHYLSPCKATSIDTLILACTHYPLVKKAIQEIIGKNVTLISSEQHIISVFSTILSLEQIITTQSSITLLTSGDKNKLEKKVRTVLQEF